MFLISCIIIFFNHATFLKLTGGGLASSLFVYYSLRYIVLKITPFHFRLFVQSMSLCFFFSFFFFKGHVVGVKVKGSGKGGGIR